LSLFAPECQATPGISATGGTLTGTLCASELCCLVHGVVRYALRRHDIAVA
jgi:hypothetical protein